MLAGDEVVDHAAAKRAWPIERVQRNQVFEPLRLGFAQNVAHAAALELENAVGLPVLKNLIRLGIVQWNGVDVELHARGPLDLGNGVGNQRQRTEAEKIHFQEADAFDLLHRPLRGDFVPRSLVERRVLGDRPGRNHDTSRVDRGMPRHAFEPPGDAQQLLHLRIGPLHFLERRALFERLVERHIQRRRNLFRNLVDVGKRHLQHAPDIANDRLGFHRAERDDLRHVLAAVLPGDVVDHFAAPPLAEIDIDIRQRDAFRVQEPFEDQIEVDWIDVRDAHAVRYQAARGGSAPRTDRNALFARIPDEVPDNQEVPRVPHLLDHVDFVREPAFVLVDGVAQEP